MNHEKALEWAENGCTCVFAEHDDGCGYYDATAAIKALQRVEAVHEELDYYARTSERSMDYVSALEFAVAELGAALVEGGE